MDWRSTRRSRLARAVLGTVPREPERGRRPGLARVSDLWERFWAFSSWEKLVVALGCALAAIAAPVAVVALMTGGGGGDDQPQVPAVINLPGATSVQLPATATPFPPPTTPPPTHNPPTPLPRPRLRRKDRPTATTAMRSGAPPIAARASASGS